MFDDEADYSMTIESRHRDRIFINRSVIRGMGEKVKTNPHFADLAKEKIELEHQLKSVWELSEIHWGF